MTTAIEHVKAFCRDELEGIVRDPSCRSPDELFEYLTGFGAVWKNTEAKHRWWMDVFVVTEVNGKLIGYMSAETTGDNSIRDVGWEFDPGSICYVEKKTKTITYYTPVQENT